MDKLVRGELLQSDFAPLHKSPQDAARIQDASPSSFARLLGALYALDSQLTETFGANNRMYLLYDQSIAAISGAASNSLNYGFCSEILSTIGMIYRFNAAMKFGYPERGVFQLRINSWGHLWIASHAMKDYVAHCKRRCEKAFLQFQNEYLELIDASNAQARPLLQARIHALNDSVPIPLVA